MSKILLVDDEASVQKMVERRLLAKGFNVVLAHDGEEALRMARQENPDIIVMDILMPKMQGDVVAAQLRSDVRTSRIPIIFLTCLVTPEEAFRSNGIIGDNILLAKPLDGARLVSLIEQLVQKPRAG